MIKNIVLLAACLSVFSLACAEPTSAPTNIEAVRPYTSGTPTVYINAPGNPICGTSSFYIDLTQGGGKEMYASALTALATNKKVNLEIVNGTTCPATTYVRLQSITVHSN